MCAFVGAIIYMYVHTYHIVRILWSQITWVPVVLNPITYLIWTCSTLRECTHHDRWYVCNSFCMALALNVFSGQHCCLLCTFDRRIILSFGKLSSKASHVKLCASKVVPFHAVKTCKAYRGIAPPWHVMEMSGKHHAPPALPKERKYCTHWIGGWVHPRASGYLGEKRNLCPTWDSSPGPSSL
jgi:hypothetical protein